MKLYGVFGKGSGKVGNSVWAISGGEQIVRPYNPNVTNPNTDAQVAQRAKLKLMSQLGAVLAPALGFAKQGLVSARNQFVSKNIGLVDFADNEATVELTDLQLTPSLNAFPGIQAVTRTGGLTISLTEAAAADIKRVAYFVYDKTEDGKLSYVASTVIAEPGQGNVFPWNFNSDGGSFVIYAYGIKDNNAEATIRYNNYVAAAGETSAILVVASLFRSAAYALTKTSAVESEV